MVGAVFSAGKVTWMARVVDMSCTSIMPFDVDGKLKLKQLFLLESRVVTPSEEKKGAFWNF